MSLDHHREPQISERPFGRNRQATRYVAFLAATSFFLAAARLDAQAADSLKDGSATGADSRRALSGQDYGLLLKSSGILRELDSFFKWQARSRGRGALDRQRLNPTWQKWVELDKKYQFVEQLPGLHFACLGMTLANLTGREAADATLGLACEPGAAGADEMEGFMLPLAKSSQASRDEGVVSLVKIDTVRTDGTVLRWDVRDATGDLAYSVVPPSAGLVLLYVTEGQWVISPRLANESRLAESGLFAEPQSVSVVVRPLGMSVSPAHVVSPRASADLGEFNYVSTKNIVFTVSKRKIAASQASVPDSTPPAPALAVGHAASATADQAAPVTPDQAGTVRQVKPSLPIPRPDATRPGPGGGSVPQKVPNHATPSVSFSGVPSTDGDLVEQLGGYFGGIGVGIAGVGLLASAAGDRRLGTYQPSLWPWEIDQGRQDFLLDLHLSQVSGQQLLGLSVGMMAFTAYGTSDLVKQDLRVPDWWGPGWSLGSGFAHLLAVYFSSRVASGSMNDENSGAAWGAIGASFFGGFAGGASLMRSVHQRRTVSGKSLSWALQLVGQLSYGVGVRWAGGANVTMGLNRLQDTDAARSARIRDANADRTVGFGFIGAGLGLTLGDGLMPLFREKDDKRVSLWVFGGGLALCGAGILGAATQDMAAAGDPSIGLGGGSGVANRAAILSGLGGAGCGIFLASMADWVGWR